MRRNGQKTKFDALTEQQREQLIFWLCVERTTYAEALKRVREKFGVQSSSAAMSHFWYRECEPYLMRQQKLKGAFLQITIRVRQGETILGETDFAVGLGEPGAAIQASNSEITFEATAKSPRKGAS